MRTTAISITIALALGGCASYPTDPAQQAIYYADKARQELASDQPEKGYTDVVRALALPGGPERVKSIFIQDAGAKKNFVRVATSRIANIDSVYGAKQRHEDLKKIQDSAILTPAENEALRANYATVVVEGNVSGKLPFMIDSEALSIPALADAQQARIIFDRTIASYKEKGYQPRSMDSLVQFLQRTQSNSEERKIFISSLPMLNVRRSELPAIEVFAHDFATLRAAELTLEAHLVVKNADRIFADDLSSAIGRAVHGVTWVEVRPKDGLEIVVERVRSNEKEFPIVTRTVTYSNSQVDIFSAALLMPKNASYQFDMKSGGAEVEYGYVVSAWKGGSKLAENVVRGKVGGQFASCENARIVNVFGGVSSAGFTANNDMRTACSGATAVSLDDLRNQVLEKLSAEVRAIPQISVIDSMN